MSSELNFIEGFLRSQAGYVVEMYNKRKDVSISTKSNAADMLTEVDLTVQQRAVEAVNAAFPGDWIVGEEGEYTIYPENADARAWVMDPIDGTNNFVRGLFPCFAISIAFVERGIPMAAGVLIPGTGDIFLARRGQGVTRNGEPISVSSVAEIGAARLELDYGHKKDRAALLHAIPEIFCQVGEMRCHGSSVVSNCQVATGDIDAFFHINLNPWDYAAVWLFVEEAGGKVSHLDGTPIHIFYRKSGLLLSNGILHQTFLDLIMH